MRKHTYMYMAAKHNMSLENNKIPLQYVAHIIANTQRPLHKPDMKMNYRLTVPLCSRISPDNLLASLTGLVLHVDQDVLEPPMAIDVHVRYFIQ